MASESKKNKAFFALPVFQSWYNSATWLFRFASRLHSSYDWMYKWQEATAKRQHVLAALRHSKVRLNKITNSAPSLERGVMEEGLLHR